MALIGSLIKTGIDLTNKINIGETDPVKLQEAELKKLLDRAKNTAFGKYHGFQQLLDSHDIASAFKNEIGIHTYKNIYKKWWKQQLLYPDITWPGQPGYYALSSGTTGKTSKRIPVTDGFLQSMKQVGRSLMRDLAHFDFPESLFESEILMLSSSANLQKHDQGHLEGEISGINVSNFPDWYELFYRPGKEIASIDNWDERVMRMAKEAPDWDIGAIACIPSWVLLMLQKTIEINQLDTIHDIWPNLQVYATGGVAFETYRGDFEKVCRTPLQIIDTYLASEGFFAYTARPDTMSMKLAVSHGYYFEFIPFDERGVTDTGELLDDPVSFDISEVSENEEYVLVVSTCSGAWRYVIGDTIEFTDLEKLEIKITGRTKFYLNTVGSQLSEEKLDRAILETAESESISVNEYSVAAVRNENNEYIHQWIVVSDQSVNEEQFREKLDQSLKDANKNYGVARSKALKGIKVKAISKQRYHEYLENRKKKGGQIKTPKVTDETTMYDYLEFLS